MLAVSLPDVGDKIFTPDGIFFGTVIGFYRRRWETDVVLADSEIGSIVSGYLVPIERGIWEVIDAFWHRNR